MNSSQLTLLRPHVAFEVEFMEMVRDFHIHEETRFDDEIGLRDEDFAAYVRWLQEGEQGLTTDTLVPWTTFWLMRNADRAIVGVGSLRHFLVPRLEVRGGHIGYAIRPSERHKGYGTSLLSLILQEARPRGFSRVLLTCDAHNLASSRIIEKNGGQLENCVKWEEGEMISRFWIDLG